MRILLVNDDGIHSDGLNLLADYLNDENDIWVVAPEKEMSVASHSLTLHKPLRIREEGHQRYSVSGTPADCVYIAVRELMKRRKPDLLVSGINRGENLAQDVFFSGTVAGARQGTIFGIPSLSMSMVLGIMGKKKIFWESACEVCKKVVDEMGRMKFPKNTFLNINVPNRKYENLKGLRLCRQGFRQYGGDVLKRIDHRGKPYYWLGGRYLGHDRSISNSDCSAVERGYVSITPLDLNCTHDFGKKSRFFDRIKNIR